MAGKSAQASHPTRTARLRSRTPPHPATAAKLAQEAAPPRARDSRTPGVWLRRQHGCSSRGAFFGKTLLLPLLHPIAHRRTGPSGKSEFPECDCECRWSQSQSTGSMIAQNMIAATATAEATVAQAAATDAAGAGAAEAEATTAAAAAAEAAAAAQTNSMIILNTQI